MFSWMPGARDLEGDPHLAHEYAELLGDGSLVLILSQYRFLKVT